ncbi:helix-turn-helix domain-containing protein [Streptomyces malaysiensis]|nr:helix-turn-helix transcriptional regulator [Streptomyces malaysiensis]
MEIRRLREERGYSLEELAERSGLSFRGLIWCPLPSNRVV